MSEITWNWQVGLIGSAMWLGLAGVIAGILYIGRGWIMGSLIFAFLGANIAVLRYSMTRGEN